MQTIAWGEPMKIAMCLFPEIDGKWHHALQLGVTEAVAVGNGVPLWEYLPAARLVKKYQDFGFNVSTFEGWLQMDNIKRGTELAEAETEQFITAIRNLGALGVSVLCYSWMAKYSWIRTSFSKQTRGGALTTAYEDEVSTSSPEFQGPPIITQKKLWETLEGFLEKVLPVC
jgi:mannonate dehydratase